ncbi:Coiled-coil domain-containing protein 22 [Phytophthora boehmeriae]|uniref:Coiled-coil domain-containing protein 22 n=1 Tax=Phytophthora boehmeriae TaxID=109152 RepID=A0A8T1X5G0_9STRA|nr:Coiled-coil domain-containing protein 22 [Phytophthora boehmeriae]
MAEADAFIFAALQQSGILEADSQASSWSVSALSSDDFIAIVLQFLTQLQTTGDNATFTLPSTLTNTPVGVAARHRVGSKLANILKELGYAGDCGYNHFLYPNEKETRNILSWLVGKLPRTQLEGELEEEEHKTEVLAVMRTRGETQGSDLSAVHLGTIFSAWKKEKKTLYVMKNHDVKGLRGFQCLPLKSSTVELPWRLNKTKRRLFEDFPSDSVKVTSLLEALVVEKIGASMVFPEDEFEEHIETAEGVETRKAGNVTTNSTTDVENSLLYPLSAEVEDDQFAVIQPQAFLANTLPDVPHSLESDSSLIASDTVASGDTIAEFAGSSSVATKNVAGEEIISQHKISEEGEEETLKQVQAQVEDMEHRIAAMRKVLDRERGELEQVEQHVLETQATGQEMQKQLTRQKQLLAMLPQATTNIAKLEAMCRTNAEKKAEIAQQMENARDSLLKEYALLESQKSNRKARCRQLIKEMKSFRSEMLGLTGVIHLKMENMRSLERIHERQLAKLDKKADRQDGELTTRNMYTARIMDIIKQVHKQKQDIAKILDDIKGLQKKMNVTSEKLKRTEAVAEEKLFTAASKSKTTNSGKSEAYVECYRKFAQVRDLFEELIVLVGEVGKKENMTRDLQNWISQLEARDSSSHLDKVLADLESVRHDNGTLQNELRARSA